MTPFQTLRLYLRLSRPLLLVSVALIYALGTGAARYLGATIDWQVYLLGQAWVTLLQLSTHYLADYFTFPVVERSGGYPPLAESSGALGPEGLPRPIALWLGLACLTVVAYLTMLLLQAEGFVFSILLMLLLLFAGCLSYATPPLRLVTSGYGELTASVLVANLVPTLAFLLQNGELHRLLAMTTFPLTALQLAMMLALNLPGYASDLRQARNTVMTRLGWERGMMLHNYLILFAFLLIGAAPLLGFPGRVFLPCLLALPIGLYQIWLMHSIAEGARPNWQALSVTSMATFGVTAYLLLFAFWTI